MLFLDFSTLLYMKMHQPSAFHKSWRPMAISQVLKSWRNRLDKTERDTQLVQLRVCTEIAIQCTDFNPAKRPDIEHITDRLGATKSVGESSASYHKGQESLWDPSPRGVESLKHPPLCTWPPHVRFSNTSPSNHCSCLGCGCVIAVPLSRNLRSSTARGSVPCLIA